jgi:hypothetical protein
LLINDDGTQCLIKASAKGWKTHPINDSGAEVNFPWGDRKLFSFTSKTFTRVEANADAKEGGIVFDIPKGTEAAEN